MFLFLFFLQQQSDKTYEDPTLSALIEKFYARAEKKKIFLRPRLNFLLQLSCKNNNVREKFAAPVRMVIDDEKWEQLLAKLDQNNLTDLYLKLKVDLAIEFQKGHVQNRSQQILNGIDYHLPTYLEDADFYDSYQNWYNNPTEVEHIHKVEENIKTMANQFEKRNIKFNKEMKTVNEITAGLNMLMDNMDKVFDELWQTTDIKRIPDIIKYEAYPLIERIEKQQDALKPMLTNLSETLRMYNIVRKRWAEHLIGMRESLTKNRIPVAPVKLTFLQALCGAD